MNISGMQSKIGKQNMKKIVITGVSTGIGFASAKILCDAGYKVYGSVRKKQDADKLCNEYPDLFKTLVFDVRDEEAIKEASKIVKNDLFLKCLIDLAEISSNIEK